MQEQRAFSFVMEELRFATVARGTFASPHEGYAVIKEELDELWEAIKDQNVSQETQVAEARQVAAMAIRYMIDFG